MKLNIKIFLFFTIGFALYNSFSFAQGTAEGIYLSGSDFSNNKLSFTPIQGRKYKLHLNEFFDKPTIKIIVGDSTFTLHKDAIFGYRDAENTSYRFYKRAVYKVLNPNETILLYSRTMLGGYRSSQTIVQYYFSAGANKEIQPLTKWDIKNAFSSDSAFCELLDPYFPSDDHLRAYDNFNKMYKLNHVLLFAGQMAIKNK